MLTKMDGRGFRIWLYIYFPAVRIHILGPEIINHLLFTGLESR